MKLQQVYKQPMIRRKWSVTNPSKAMRILHKITFGRYGEIPTVKLDETQIYLYCQGAPKPEMSSWEQVGMATRMNCRCSMGGMIPAGKSYIVSENHPGPTLKP